MDRTVSSKITSAITKQLACWFRDWGWPRSIRSDGGPQFRSEFEAWCVDRHIQIDGPSSAHYHQSNGLAENAVKQCEYLLAKIGCMNDTFFDALAEYRNTPRADGYSASQLFFGRRQRGLLPTLPSTLTFDAKIPLAAHTQRQKSTAVVESRYNARASDLPPLHVGQAVLLQNPLSLRWEEKGQVEEIRNDGRSYYVAVNGKQLLRNRRFLRPYKVEVEVAQPQQGHEDAEPAPNLRRSDRIKKRSVRFA